MSKEYAAAPYHQVRRADRAVTDDDWIRALQKLLDKYFPHLKPRADYRSIQSEELARTAVYRIGIEFLEREEKEAPADFPGAFLYGEHDG